MADTVEKVKQIKNINRDYLVSIDIKNSTVSKENLNFYITDKKTSNIYVQLVINMSTNNYISKFVVLEEASNYQTQLNIVKPNNEPKTITGELLDEDNAIFLFDLEDDCKDLVGTYNCEVYASCIVNGRTEGSTSDPFDYTVKASIFNDLDELIESDEDYPIILELIEQIKGLTGDIDTSQFATKKYVQEAIESLDLSGIDIDLSNYTTKEELLAALKEKSSVQHTHVATDIVEDDTHKFVTQSEKDLWNDTAKNKQDLTIYATTESVNSALANYVTKETGNANQITFNDGQTFQEKLDAETLKGAKGDQGEPGANGSDYILTDSDKVEIADIAGANVDLSDYAKIADLSGFITSDSLNSYVTIESFNTALGNVESLLSDI